MMSFMNNKFLISIKNVAVFVLIIIFFTACFNPVEPREIEPSVSDLSEILLIGEELGEFPEPFTDFIHEHENDSINNDTVVASEQNTELPPEQTPEPQIPVSTNENIINSITNLLEVIFIDVGQGDAILIKLPNGQIMLIDGGESRDADNVIRLLNTHGISTIDFLVATHPHADHIGGLPIIIDTFEIRAIYMPRKTHTSLTYERLLDSIENKGLQIDAAKAGVEILSLPDLLIEIVAPVRENYSNLNDHGVVIKLIYGNTSFLFTGDIESVSERDITADISVDVLKVSHHGAKTSTSIEFLNKVLPTYAVISVGNNTYGHPEDIILSRLYDAGIDVYRTDLQGTIQFTSDGSSITVDKIPEPYQPAALIDTTAGNGTGNSSSIGSESTGQDTSNPDEDIIVYTTRTGARYHKDGCRHLSQSKIESTLSEAKRAGLTACGTCKPPG